jgi:capsid protein
MWNGVTMGHVDPKKEVEAAIMRINHNLSTEEQEAAEYNGNDWSEVVRQRRKEIEALADLMPAVTDDPEDNSDEKEEEEE